VTQLVTLRLARLITLRLARLITLRLAQRNRGGPWNQAPIPVREQK
jgi:hypothetical protein